MQTNRFRTVVLVATVGLALAAVACSEDVPGHAAGPSHSSTPSATPVAEDPSPSKAAEPNPLVGRWEQEHTCVQLVAALDSAGLRAAAPGVVGDFFPDATAQELAAKHDICSGAVPQVHAHFFDADGAFGSLDQDGEQVDDGPYTVEGDRLTIGGDGDDVGHFRATISGDTLVLVPVIAPEDITAALVDPYEFSLAGWQVAVTYGGLPFHRVPCGQWC